MTATAQELLDRFAKIGASVRRDDKDRLVVRAGTRPVPAAMVRQLRESKAQTLAALASNLEPQESDAGDTDPTWWQQHFINRAIHWELRGYRCQAEAEKLAWGDLQIRWHRQHGKRFLVWQCAGCDQPVGSLPTLDVGDGNQVHLHTLDCLIRYGYRWRGGATRALAAMGLTPPGPPGPKRTKMVSMRQVMRRFSWKATRARTRLDARAVGRVENRSPIPQAATAGQRRNAVIR
jgi:hypothetical protein